MIQVYNTNNNNAKHFVFILYNVNKSLLLLPINILNVVFAKFHNYFIKWSKSIELSLKIVNTTISLSCNCNNPAAFVASTASGSPLERGLAHVTPVCGAGARGHCPSSSGLAVPCGATRARCAVRPFARSLLVLSNSNGR